ncbi:replication-associated recombination protein A [Methylophilaceae bacterium]|jgi:putative ATPase|nr:replication-associated recombination protein A [Betaproteobacteria bacterium]MDA9096890.1 replication-associated recombination protein A [Methylophilaceae bacterium]MDC0552885.1 replication-associated recombination protein A [Methylophilaceae bacterium]MDC0877653.1 replication-associated recombination protein A [Methylophilaceae bacterium]MDC1281070.1 replication-associated recombination protein A [Methylophilaceae bacterium]
MKDNLTKPLAEILRPKKVHDIVGQIELLGEGQSLKVAIEGKSLPSMILWGPPGVGKTSVAHVISNCIDAEFLSISAVLSGVKEIREAIEKAQFMKEHQQRNTILFVDEVHRFNKSQQDAFLPHIESGLITFIGATTENPSFEVNSALLSRCQVYVLKALNEKELESILDKALKLYPERSINEEARNLVVTYADGDARKLINLVEMLLSSHAAVNSSAIDELDVKKIVADKTRRFDKGGDQFYDQISALHKSVRGSDPDAALYWLFKMLDGGADPLYLSRRIIRIAIEDIGLADPRAQTIALEAYQIYERLGFPEAELALSNAVIYLSMAPKSNSAYHAYNMVKKYIANQGHFNVPIHLKNAPTKLMDNLGYGKNYRYAHNEDHAYAAGEKYFPDELEPVEFYKPTDRGLEKKISEKKLFLRQLDQQYKNNKSE